MKSLTSKDLLSANFAVPSDSKIGLDNLSKIRDGSETFYAVTLDDRVIKTMYKDPLYIPTKALAMGIAEEWESQLDTIDMRTMHLNNMMSKAVKCRLDDTLDVYMKKEILKVIMND